VGIDAVVLVPENESPTPTATVTRQVALFTGPDEFNEETVVTVRES
jgi:hypothetical protein